MALENRAPLLNVLDQWEDTEPQDLPLNSLKTHPKLQPRDLALIKSPMARIEQESKLSGMVTDMKTPLKEIPTFNARDPILVANTEKGMFVTDGHHRLKAYKEAGRPTIPARVLNVSMGTAIAISRIVNTRGSTVALHKDEVTGGVWATVSALMQYGKRDKQAATDLGYSLNCIREMFGCQVSRDTISKMRKGVEWLHMKGVSRDEWPDWKGYRKLRRDGMTELPEDPEDEAVERLAMKLLQVMADKPDQVTQPAISRALELREAAQRVLDKSLGITHGVNNYDPDDPDAVY